MIKRPPEHAADATPLYIAPFDDAVDHDRIAKDKTERPDDEHCTDAYWSGTTRYDVDAPHTIGGSTVTVRHYIKPDAVPTVFKLRRVAPLERQVVMRAITDARDPSVKGNSRDLVAGVFRLCRLGVVEVTEGFGGEPWDLEGGAGVPLTDKDMQTLYDASANLPEALGWAVFHASKPLSESEGKL